MTTEIDVLIIGSGPAGIGSAIPLGDRALVVERRKILGGLCGSVELEGAVFDVGGHSFHTPHPEVRELVHKYVDMYEQRRQARCFSYQTLIDYPFQKHFHEIQNPGVVDECTRGLAAATGSKGTTNFEDYLVGRFGDGMAKHFMLPYNRKLWGRDLHMLDVDWVGERVAAPTGVKETFDQSGGKRKPLQDDTKVAYPARGGFGEIIKALAKLATVRLGVDIMKIDPERRQAVAADGHVFQWKTLVSTMPLPELAERVVGTPPALRQEITKLDFLSMKVVFVAIGHPVDTPIQRIYSSDARIAAHKIAINHNSSDYLRSLPHHGVMAEISYSAIKPLARPDVEQWTVENLLELGIIKSQAEVVNTMAVDIRYAYPVPTHDRARIVAEAKTWFESQGIQTTGRFGEWDYVNSDECIHRGLALGKALGGTRDPMLG